MRHIIHLLSICLAALIPCHASTSKWNVLFISVDDLRNDLGALGAPHAKTPALDAFARTARIFSHHYVQVPTCGASRCALLRGRYPSDKQHLNNHGILTTHPDWGSNSLPATFRKSGYQTLALGKISHFPGGRTGKHWIDGPEELPGAWDRSWVPESPWKSPEAMMHGYANGIARKPGKSPPLEAFDGPDSAYPDAWIADEASKTLNDLSKSEKPWFFCVGFFKPHLPFTAPKRWLDLHPLQTQSPPIPGKPKWPSGWHNSGEFRGNYGHNGRDPATDPTYAAELRRAYAASISYVDAQIGKVITTLHSLGMEKNTVVVLWSDHGFLLGEHAIWGKHCLYENALRSPLIIRHPGLTEPGKTSTATVETVDLFPTLTDLCNLQAPPNLDGQSLRPHLKNPATPSSKPARSFWTAGQRTLRNDRWRIITDGKGNRVELFDLLNDPSETKNVAPKNPEIVMELKSLMLAE
jgi:iduronate 2-sulfatase